MSQFLTTFELSVVFEAAWNAEIIVSSLKLSLSKAVKRSLKILFIILKPAHIKIYYTVYYPKAQEDRLVKVFPFLIN